MFSPHPHPFSSEALGWMWGRPEGISFPRKPALLFLFLQREILFLKTADGDYTCICIRICIECAIVCMCARTYSNAVWTLNTCFFFDRHPLAPHHTPTPLSQELSVIQVKLLKLYPLAFSFFEQKELKPKSTNWFVLFSLSAPPSILCSLSRIASNSILFSIVRS